MSLIRLALGNVYGVLVLALATLVLGGLAAATIPVDILPAFKTPAVQVLTYFNGMPAASVEKTLTNRIERNVNQAPGVRLITSRSLPGVSIVRVIFRDDTDPNAALTLANTLAQNTLPTLPPNTLPPVVLPYDPTGSLPLGILTVSNPRLDEARVKDVARIEVRSALGTLPGVVAPVVVGGKDRTVLVYLDPLRLRARNLSSTDIIKALAEGNLMVSPGTAYFGDNQVLLDSNSMVAKVADLNDLPVRLPGGDTILLGDVGRAEDAAAIQTSRVRINGKQQVYVPVYRQGGASSLAVANAVRNNIPLIEQTVTEGTRLQYVMDQSEYVRTSIESLVKEGGIGILLVGVMIFLFLGNPRMTIIAAVTLPLSILAALIGLRMLGETVNVMTLGGLFLAIGPLIDEAIVMLENTHRHMGMGKNPVRAAYDAVSELTLPALVAVLALVIVLAAIALTPGLGGFLFKPLAIAVALAMAASWFFALTLVPALCSVLLKADDHGTGWVARIHAPIERVLRAIENVYERLLGGFVARGKLGIAMVAIVFFASLTLVLGIGQEFFPAVDAGQIIIQVRTPSSNRLDATERRVAELEALIEKKIPAAERETIVSEIGINPDWSAAYTPNAGQMDAVVRVQLSHHRRFSAQQYAVKLRRAVREEPGLSDLRVNFDTGGMVAAALNFGSSSPIIVRLEGGRGNQAADLAEEIRTRAQTVRGAADVRVHQRDDAPYLIIEVKRQKAAEVGLSTRDVLLQVVTAMNSSASINRNFWIDQESGNQYFVAVQYPEDPDRKLEDLQTVYATGTSQSTPVPLGSLVDIRDARSAVELNHANLRRVTEVLVNTENRDTGSVARDIRAKLADLQLPPGMRMVFEGEYARMMESFQSLGFGLTMAALLVYLMMVPLFRSFLGPLVVMSSLPLGLIGVLAILFLTKTTLNVQSAMGVIFLVGIAVAQGVLLIDFANKLRAEGMHPREAAIKAAAIRLRPILMTFLATFLDLLPLALGLERGSEAITPLARAVVGGLLTSTVLTLFVVPTLYSWAFRPSVPGPDLDTLLTEPATGGTHG
ncbi:MAG: efflux RND transporter permease subunit [Gemmataceae bacterium]|nr:efflux RND transporter permease subunit [Gemmataceae bacterium]